MTAYSSCMFLCLSVIRLSSALIWIVMPLDNELILKKLALFLATKLQLMCGRILLEFLVLLSCCNQINVWGFLLNEEVASRNFLWIHKIKCLQSLIVGRENSFLVRAKRCSSNRLSILYPLMQCLFLSSPKPLLRVYCQLCSNFGGKVACLKV